MPGLSASERARMRGRAEAWTETIRPTLALDLLRALDAYEWVLTQWRSEIPDAMREGRLSEVLEEYAAGVRVDEAFAAPLSPAEEACGMELAERGY